MAHNQNADLRVEVTEESPVVRLLEVKLDEDRVTKAFDRAFRDLGRSVRVRGFRPGKTPRSVLRKLYGAAVAEDLERTLISETLGAAVEQSQLTPVSEPAIDADPPAEGTPFVYRARVEVKPEIELGDVKGLAARRVNAEVSDEDVDSELEGLRQRQASLVEEAEDVPAATGHILSIDFVGRIDGKPFEGGTGRDVSLELGAGQFVAGFDEQLEGVSAGEDRTVRVRFPDDYGNAELAGREAEFEVHVASIRRREVPDLDDELAKDLGDFETLEDLRARIRGDLEARRQRAAEAALRRSVVDSLIERVSFEVPPGLVEQRLQRRLHMARHELEERGLPRELVDLQASRWEEEWRPEAERDIREGWLLSAVAAREGLGVEDEEVEARLREIAAREGSDPASIERAYRQAGVLDALREQLLEDKAVQFLLAEATVEEVAES